MAFLEDAVPNEFTLERLRVEAPREADPLGGSAYDPDPYDPDPYA